MSNNSKKKKLYIVLVSVHGLVRGRDMELGRDSDTGGQIKYVVELARALGAHPAVERVDLITRLIVDQKVSRHYAEPEEKIGENAYIIRVPVGIKRYLRKEVLWPYLDSFTDQALQHISAIGSVPDIVHGHYADAGYVGSQLANQLGVPFVFTGHSLGREKLRLLLEKGQKRATIETQYNIGRRIEAEEQALDSAALVIASTQQEVEEQYCQYDDYQPERMVVIPPGTDIHRFTPPGVRYRAPSIKKEIDRFLKNPKKPMILAMSRPDERKNIATLVKAYGESDELRDKANLVIIAGSRDDISSMDKGSRDVLTQLLFLIDRYNLYGSIAYPKKHVADDVPDIYRLAAHTNGIFINPALTEPFGLTIIEAAASGLPIVATNDGGPIEILGHCKNGILVDPLDKEAIRRSLLHLLNNKTRWMKYSDAGVRCVAKRYSWASHAENYIKNVSKLIKHDRKSRAAIVAPSRNRLPTLDRMIVCDIDNTLLGEEGALKQLLREIRKSQHPVGFAVATGRGLESAMEVLEEWGVPVPDVLITSVGSEIYYGHGFVEDLGWRRHIDDRWEPAAIRKLMNGVPGVRLQPKANQRNFKLSYYVDPKKLKSMQSIIRDVRKKDLHAKAIYSHEAFLDFLPRRASKGLAIRYLGAKWGLPLDRFLVAGDSGNDREMLEGDTLGVVVGNYSDEIADLEKHPRIYFAEGEYAFGILEGINYYNFLGEIQLPEEE